MSDIRFNRWLHQSGTGGVSQDSSGRVGIGTTVPTSSLDVQGGNIKIGSNILSSSGVSTFTTVNATTVNTTSIVGVTTAGITTAYITSINEGPLSGFRNRLINGDCRIDQRNNGTTSVTANGYPVDRWIIEYVGSGVLTGIQTTDVPTGQGFTNAVRLTSTARSTLSSGDLYQLTHYMEGNTTSDLNFGSSAAKTVTLSFWVKGSRTGTYDVQLANTGTRTYTRQYTISSANTWQKVVLTYPGCPDGTWLTTNGVGFSIRFGFEYGSNYAGGTTDTWLSRTNFETSFPSMTNTFTTNSNSTWFITGIQLEQGNIGTDFERRTYAQELALCQRYYWQGTLFTSGYGDTTNLYSATVYLPVVMRSQPAVDNSADTSGIVANAGLYNLSASSASIPNNWWNGHNGLVNFTTTTQITRWTTAYGRINVFKASAELL